ncbi:MAG: translation elongation factor-like protein [Patescibacteria group bacterium]|nr:translation elongation factor-like protein [Patescibacteria group bacterium]
MLKDILKSLGLAKKTKRTDKPVGEVTHYYGNLGVAIMKFNKEIAVGARVAVQGATTDFELDIASLQLDHKAVAKAPKGKEVGVKVKKKVREGDRVYLNT